MSGNETLKLRIYGSQNTESQPDQLIFESGEVRLWDWGMPAYLTVEISNMLLAVPDVITWTVEFNGLEGEEKVELLVCKPPLIGTSVSHFWEKQDGTWTRNSAAESGGNFCARIVATSPATPVKLSVSYANNAAQLRLTGLTNQPCVIEYSTGDSGVNSWLTFTNLTLPSSPFVLVDTASTNALRRYYRARQFPQWH